MYQQEKRIAYQMPEFDWIMVSEALDEYILKHIDYMDMNELTSFADHIDSVIKINNFKE